MTDRPDSSDAPAYVRSPSLGFFASLPVDRALVRYDLAGSVAHVEMLHRQGLVPAEDARAIAAGLRRIAGEVRSGEFPWRDALEDVHTNVEHRLAALVGPAAGGRLHTARSRNDQVALDERLWLRSAVRSVATGLVALQEDLVALARRLRSAPMPGFTHLQHAQPVTVGHHLLAHVWRLARDLDRLGDCLRRSDVSPLGAGALAGSTLPIDPAWTAERLGFAGTFENSIDAVSDRDYFAEFLFDLALLAVHLSAFAEELVLWASREFAFLAPVPELGGGSSLMPQKRNPDVAELARAKSGRVLGDLVALLTVLKGLPLAYDRDLQEDKPVVFDAAAAVDGTLAALHRLVPALRFDLPRLLDAAQDAGLQATDRAEALVAAGVPFREAHVRVGESLAAGGPTGTAPPSGAPPVAAALERRASPGGPGPVALDRQFARVDAMLARARESLSELVRKDGRVDAILTEGEA